MDEESYEIGRNRAYITVMMNCAKALGFDGIEALNIARVAWIEERQAAITALHDLCENFGDNDWPDELHLGDVIEKHLARHLHNVRDSMIERRLISPD